VQVGLPSTYRQADPSGASRRIEKGEASWSASAPAAAAADGRTGARSHASTADGGGGGGAATDGIFGEKFSKSDDERRLNGSDAEAESVVLRSSLVLTTVILTCGEIYFVEVTHRILQEVN
jgi:hypothetical protein